jgi:hypothetical protein
MNIPKAPELEEIDPEAFIETPLNIYQTTDYGMNIQYVEFVKNNVKHKGELILTIGLDPAVATSKTADDTVIVVSGYVRAFPYYKGMDYETVERSEGTVYPVIAHIQGGRYAIHEQDTRKGMAEELIKLVKRYKINYISIEAQGQQKAIVDEIRRTFQDKKISVPIMEEYTQMKKEERINSIIISVIQRYKSVICQPSALIMTKLYHQLMLLGIGDHDDYPDAWAIAMKNLNPPSKTIINKKHNVNSQQPEDDPLAWLFR